MNFRLARTLALVALIGASSAFAADPEPGKQVEQTLKSEKVDGGTLDYLLFVPNPSKGNQKPPLMLFLHGAGERGNGNLPLVKKHGPPKNVESNPDFPFVVISPQCPTGKWWTDENLQTMLLELIDKIETEQQTDSSRVYLTGLSMGGFGSWKLAAAHPERFAAVVPICGGGDPADAKSLAKLPIWVFHGAKDTAVPLKRSEEMVEAVKEAGGNIEFTVYPEAGHDSWTETYNNPKLYDWLLKYQTK
ncbi:MAG: prolyl oligopeptidase family serine peptidase [Planctomycetales bacterium]|nr:prolyl oligopeptidase family serine peptidase [Planctomycetales bacterium]MCA9164178.1 prolyl oligopeptidase family serine peptidase [Planctomycetales bacterium]MCA9221405.1 prolyl oligopeptidase family serine peptidase [Planctomycetales bacterium]MCA9227269.1 prolyl oligopeptidase family serine peptidase [Planctomycetales bacterium]